MKELAVLLRKMQLAAHNFHNTVTGEDFMQDHSHLGDLYPAYESEYDSIIERIIGLYGRDSLDLIAIQISAVEQLKQYPAKCESNTQCFEVLLHCEKELCDHVEKLCKVPGVTQGSQNLLAQLADNSESRQYKLKNRVQKQLKGSL